MCSASSRLMSPRVGRSERKTHRSDASPYMFSSAPTLIPSDGVAPALELDIVQHGELIGK